MPEHWIWLAACAVGVLFMLAFAVAHWVCEAIESMLEDEELEMWP